MPYAPSLLGWAQEQTDRSIRYANEASNFEPMMMDDPLGMGFGNMPDLPAPPRCAPAAEAAGAYGGGFVDDLPGPSRQFNLTVLTSDNKWETLYFSSSDDLDRRGSAFLQDNGLKAAFQTGLVQKMHSMISMGETNSSVDIVDLI